MNLRDSFTVYLRSLRAAEVDFEVFDEADRRHILRITDDITLFVRPGADDLDASIAGLRKLAAKATEMAYALDAQRNAGGESA